MDQLWHFTAVRQATLLSENIHMEALTEHLAVQFVQAGPPDAFGLLESCKHIINTQMAI